MREYKITCGLKVQCAHIRCILVGTHLVPIQKRIKKGHKLVKSMTNLL